MSRPLITALIDTYNHEPYIEQAVVSAVEQDFPSADYEILVVDDGSTDRTAEIVRKFAPRVRLLQKKNGGQASAFNAGVGESRGEIIAFLDGDDWFAPGKLTAVTNALDQNPQAAAVGHGFYRFHEKTKKVEVCAPPGPKFLHLATPESAREAGNAWMFVLMGALTVRKRMLERAMPIPEALRFCADTHIALAARATGTYVLEQPLFYYRHHGNNHHENDLSDPGGLTKMRRRLELQDLALELGLGLLAELGVRSDCARALLWPAWVQNSQVILSTFGGSRLATFRTEMRSFHTEFRNPSIAYRAFKYGVVGPATLLVPPVSFYKLKGWYARRNLARFRNWVCRQERREF